MNKENIKRFNRFLKDNGAYRAFFKNFDELFGYDRKVEFKDYLKKVPCSEAISMAFSWPFALYGKVDFWSKLDDNWQKALYENDR